MGNTPVLGSMAALRVISGLIEIATALVFLKAGRIETALRLNAFLGLVGPVIFLAVSALGIVAIAVKLPPAKVALVSLGILLVLWGTSIRS